MVTHHGRARITSVARGGSGGHASVDQSVGLVTMRNTITMTSIASTIPTVVPRLDSDVNSAESGPVVASTRI